MATRLELPSEPKSVQERNKACWNDGRSITDADFFTFGYSGRPTDEIFSAIRAAGVSTVVDIRFTPVSMYKPDFSKRNLERIVQSHDLAYVHLPWLGVPKEVRTMAAQAQDRNLIWDWYDEQIVSRFIGRNLHTFLNIAEHPLAFMCVEIDPSPCHRHRLFQALEDRGFSGFDL